METETFTSAGAVADTRAGLLDDPKWLSSLYFYDEYGSHLFEKICETPEYYPTRTEAAILAAHAPAMLDETGPDLLLAELGSGSSSKTRIVIEALLTRGPATYVPVDVSQSMLEATAARLEQEHPGLTVHALAEEYGAGLQRIGEHPATRRLVLFLGSSIGNFEPDEQVALLAAARQALNSGDALLLGTDLTKDPAVLEAAYNDAAGFTARFNKNILTHLNRVLDGDADPDTFEHVAHWNPDKSRVEMHLRSLRDQRLTFARADLDVPLRSGEMIHTENSYKFTTPGVARMANQAGLALEQTWTDDHAWFAVHLLRVP